MSVEAPDPTPPAATAQLTQCLQSAYALAEAAHLTNDYSAQKAVLGDQTFAAVEQLGARQHAARGVVLTLAAYKVIRPAQDIRAHKVDHPGGFSGRSIDNAATIPFLQANGLYYNVESHWLTQSFSFAGPYVRGSVLKLSPKALGPILIEILNAIQEAAQPVEFAKAVVVRILGSLIDERNRGKIPLEKPQNLSIDQTIRLLKEHFLTHYEKNAPRLPQVAIYAIYQCIMPTMTRYKNLTLMPLERMKAANRKSGSVGDIDVNRDAQPFEAVEIKFQVSITRDHVAEAIQKIKTVSVQRYFIFSTAGIADGEADEIHRLRTEFRRSNGCEIIVNGVLDTINYYLRLIDSPAMFVNRYTALIEKDADLSYQHRVAWNAVCAARS